MSGATTTTTTLESNPKSASLVNGDGGGCFGCGEQIHDQFILRVAPNLEWHAACLVCAECKMFLDENHTCFVRGQNIYCKQDYLRLFGSARQCDKCRRPFGRTDLFMRAKNRIYHLDCFSCETCKKRLVQGDEFSVQSDGRLFCRDDSVFDDGDGDMNDNNNNNGDGDDLRGQERHVAKKEEELNEDDEDMMDMEEEEEDIEKCDNNIQGLHQVPHHQRQQHQQQQQRSLPRHPQQQQRRSRAGRVRTVLTEKQLSLLKSCYSANPRPDALMKEQLVEMTGLSPRVVRVWFQNKRCKDKKKLALKQGKEGRKMGYAMMPGVPMIASSPLRTDSPRLLHSTPGGPGLTGPAEVHQYEAPWKALCDFALHSDLDKLNPNYQQIVNQMHGYDHGENNSLPPSMDYYDQQQQQQLQSTPLPSFDHQQQPNHGAVSPSSSTGASYTLTTLDSTSPLGRGEP